MLGPGLEKQVWVVLAGPLAGLACGSFLPWKIEGVPWARGTCVPEAGPVSGSLRSAVGGTACRG